MVETLKKIKYYKLYKFQNLKKVICDSFDLVGHQRSTEEALDNTIEWILNSFAVNGDGGSSAYYSLATGWKASYPETTGYIIPTLYDYYRYSNDENVLQIAKNAADWLLSIQSSEGGWQGLQVDVNYSLRVFNSGMILDGLIATYKNTNNSKYLEAGIRGAKWVVSKMDNKGFFSDNNVYGGGAFDTLVLAGVLMVLQYMEDNDEKVFILNKVKFSLEVHGALQKENGSWGNCKCHVKSTMLLHHIAYTLDGLIICSDIIGNEKYYKKAKITARKLLSIFEVHGELASFYYLNWEPYKDIKNNKNSICLTGYAQISIVFQKIYRKENDLRYLNAALKINDILNRITNFNSKNKGLKYGVPGSYPIYGDYQKYQLVNWAAKYFAESLLLSMDKCDSKKMK